MWRSLSPPIHSVRIAWPTCSFDGFAAATGMGSYSSPAMCIATSVRRALAIISWSSSVFGIWEGCGGMLGSGRLNSIPMTAQVSRCSRYFCISTRYSAMSLCQSSTAGRSRNRRRRSSFSMNLLRWTPGYMIADARSSFVSPVSLVNKVFTSPACASGIAPRRAIRFPRPISTGASLPVLESPRLRRHMLNSSFAHMWSTCSTTRCRRILFRRQKRWINRTRAAVRRQETKKTPFACQQSKHRRMTETIFFRDRKICNNLTRNCNIRMMRDLSRPCKCGNMSSAGCVSFVRCPPNIRFIRTARSAACVSFILAALKTSLLA
mmetsp:Transcript_46741/g.123539  ORF Transcript_46741/g.123539 Transcript_46741/m.123539 type:complete len:321 (-) Transcript_46741:1037-1999(-)